MSVAECTTNGVGDDACCLTTPGPDLVTEQKNEKRDAAGLENEEKHDVDFTELNDQERILLYDKGVQFKRKQSTRHALHCLLGCLQGLKDGSKFPMLPECLKHIADIYVKEGDYESAISFVQAEKLYYETALISVGSTAEEVQGSEQKSSKKPEIYKSGGNNSQDVSSLPEQDQKLENEESTCSELVKKADEYEKLSHLCLKQKNIQLALEYCGKAVKIRQSQFGENHPITTKSLNLFTVIYAEMGKEQYAAAMKKFSEVTESAKDTNKETSSVEPEHQSQVDSYPGPPSAMGGNQDTQSRQHANSETGTTNENMEEKNMDDFTKDTRAEQDIDGSQETGRSRLVDRTLIWFFMVTFLMGVLVAVLLKYASRRDFQAMYKYTVTRIKYFYYFHFRQAQRGDKFF